MHPSVVVSLVSNFYKTYFIQMHYLRGVRQYLMDEAAILTANALVIVFWTFVTLFTEVCPVSTYASYSVFKTHSVGLSQTAIGTHRHLIFSHNSIGCQLSFAVFSKLPLYKFLHSHPSYLYPHCLFTVEDKTQSLLF